MIRRGAPAATGAIGAAAKAGVGAERTLCRLCPWIGTGRQRKTARSSSWAAVALCI